MPTTRIADTDKAKNLNVEVTTNLDLDTMEALLESVGQDLELTMTHITTLSKKKYPGNRHWHFKEGPKTRGTLDVTYWPDGQLVWITVRQYEPDWVHVAGPAMAAALSLRL